MKADLVRQKEAAQATKRELLNEDMNSSCLQCQLSIACNWKILVLSLLLEEAVRPPVHCRTEEMLWALHQCDVSSICVSLAQLLC